jgi:hypothetical protein
VNNTLITYDLRKPGANYTDLIRAIKALGDWWHPLLSTWIVKTHYTPEQVKGLLLPYIDVNDGLLVAQIAGNVAGYNLNK